MFKGREFDPSRKGPPSLSPFYPWIRGGEGRCRGAKIRTRTGGEKSGEKNGTKSRAVDFSIRLNKKPRDRQTRWKLAAFFSTCARIVFRFSREEGTVGKSCCAYLSIMHPPDSLLDARILHSFPPQSLREFSRGKLTRNNPVFIEQPVIFLYPVLPFSFF